jgi:polysaccharide export outer membrane protein
MAGRLGASGLTIEQLEAQLVERLKTFIREPEVSVSITEFRSQPVSVIGAVKNPGVHQLQGRKTLIEILSLAGGLDRAASPQNSRILRPCPNASNRTELAVDLKKVLAGKAQDLPLQPEDILFVQASRSEFVNSVRIMQTLCHFQTRSRCGYSQ